jgi:NCS1 family nucleobase:cation symporter-1
VLIVDYWTLRRKKLVLPDLYRKQGVYTYNSGWNWRAVVATLVGCALAWIGLVVPALSPLYAYAWFVGFGAAAITYLVLTKLAAPQAALVDHAEAG